MVSFFASKCLVKCTIWQVSQVVLCQERCYSNSVRALLLFIWIDGLWLWRQCIAHTIDNTCRLLANGFNSWLTRKDMTIMDYTMSLVRWSASDTDYYTTEIGCILGNPSSLFWTSASFIFSRLFLLILFYVMKFILHKRSMGLLGMWIKRWLKSY